MFKSYKIVVFLLVLIFTFAAPLILIAESENDDDLTSNETEKGEEGVSSQLTNVGDLSILSEDEKSLSFNIIDKGADYIEVGWSVADKEVSNFSLKLSNGLKMDIDADTTRHRLEGLQQNTWYLITLEAHYTDGTFETSILQAYLGEPKDVQFEIRNIDKINYFTFEGYELLNRNTGRANINDEQMLVDESGNSTFQLYPDLYTIRLGDRDGNDIGTFVVRIEQDLDYTEPIVIDFQDVFEVKIPDTQLREIIKSYLDLGDNVITNKDLERLVSLKAEAKSIESLTGLEHAKNLTTLHLHRNNITDLSALSDLEYLQIVNVGDNPITNLESVQNLIDSGVNVGFDVEVAIDVKEISLEGNNLTVEWDFGLSDDLIENFTFMINNDNLLHLAQPDARRYTINNLITDKWETVTFGVMMSDGWSEYDVSTTYLSVDERPQVKFEARNFNTDIQFKLHDLDNDLSTIRLGSIGDDGAMVSFSGNEIFYLAAGNYKAEFVQETDGETEVVKTFNFEINENVDYVQNPIVFDFSIEDTSNDSQMGGDDQSNETENKGTVDGESTEENEDNTDKSDEENEESITASGNDKGETLPQTSNLYFVWIVLGITSIVVGVFMMVFHRKREFQYSTVEK